MLTVANITRATVDPYLESALESWSHFADRIRVLIDATDHDTHEVEDLLDEYGAEHALWTGGGMQGNEWRARKALWDFATDQAEWVLHLDSDQTVSCDPRPYLKPPVTAFRVYDLWGDDTYRSDAWWTGHKRCWWPAVHVPSLPPGFEDEWPERGWHSGHVPLNVPGPVHGVHEGCAVLHYAYDTPEGRRHKAKMYACLDPHLTTRERFHAGTILAPKPNTLPLPFEPEWPLQRAS